MVEHRAREIEPVGQPRTPQQQRLDAEIWPRRETQLEDTPQRLTIRRLDLLAHQVLDEQRTCCSYRFLHTLRPPCALSARWLRRECGESHAPRASAPTRRPCNQSPLRADGVWAQLPRSPPRKCAARSGRAAASAPDVAVVDGGVRRAPV